jgi:hypothetical protein
MVFPRHTNGRPPDLEAIWNFRFIRQRIGMKRTGMLRTVLGFFINREFRSIVDKSDVMRRSAGFLPLFAGRQSNIRLIHPDAHEIVRASRPDRTSMADVDLVQ